MNALQTLLNLSPKILYCAIGDGRVGIKYASCEMEGSNTGEIMGIGDTIEAAADDYCSKLSGQTLVFDNNGIESRVNFIVKNIREPKIFHKKRRQIK